MNLKKWSAVISLIFILSGCQASEIPSSLPVESSEPESIPIEPEGIELENGVYIIDGIPCWSSSYKEPLLEPAPSDSEEDKQYKASRRRWLGKGGKPYQYSILQHAFFPPEQIDQMTPEDAEKLSYGIHDGGGTNPLDELPPETQEKLLGLGLDQDTLMYFLCSDLSTEYLLSLEGNEKEAFQELFTPITEATRKLEEMGMTHPRRTMTNAEETLRLALSQPSGEDFRQQAHEKGIPHWMQDELLRRGNLRSEILSMTEEEREAALIPALNKYLYYNILNAPEETWWMTKTGYSFLQMRCRQKATSEDEISRIELLGYTNYDKITLSDEEWEFLFPLAELPDKLNECGFSDEEIARNEIRLKYLVREALEIRKSFS